MAIIDVVKCDADALRGDQVYAWRFPSQELSTWTQLIVNESQEAVLVRGGVMEGPFGPGRHTLSTENIPVLSKLINLPFGRSPFTAEVWFVNRAMPLDVRWGTSDPIQVLDPQYKIMLPVRAFGQYGIQVVHSKKFLTKLVGVMDSFDRERLTHYFRGLILTRAKDCIARTIVKEKTSILEIAACLNSISADLQAQMAQELAEFGLRVVNFYVNSISTPEDDAAVRQLKGALAKRAEMEILGYTYQQERSFDTMERAAGNEGGASSTMIGGGIGIGIGAAIGLPVGGAMGQIAANLQTAPPQVAAPTRGASSAANAACPKCHFSNPAGAKFCAGCGTGLPEIKPAIPCGKCGTAVSPDALFCSNCGSKMISNCQKCGSSLMPGAKFCANCGQPQ